MTMLAGAIDCDVHPTLPGLRALFPYLDDAWRETFVQRGMHEVVSNNYPPSFAQEPEKPSHLLDIIEWIGWDRLMFATDYPHWDYDDPTTCLGVSLTETQRVALFHDNAWRFFVKE
jgi:predicted TIM-barrel fold metal-dependent hydrolase